jgi:hypothetical protein
MMDFEVVLHKLMEFTLVVLVIFLITPSIVFSQQEQSDQLRQLLELQEKREQLEDFQSEEAIQAVQEEAARDIGDQEILRRKARHKPYRVLGSVNQRITNNAALSPFVEDSDLLSTVTAGFELYPLEGNPKPLTLSAKQQLFRYRDNSAFDFDRLVLEARGTRQQDLYGVPLFFSGKYSYEEIRNGSSSGGADRGDLIRSFHLIGGSVRYFHLISRYEGLIPAISMEIEQTEGLNGQVGSFRDNEKNRFASSVTYFNQYSRKLSLFGSARLQHTEYDFVQTVNGQREDDNVSFTAGGEWSFNDYLKLNVTAYHGRNNSNGSTFEYDVTNLGSQIQLSYNF